MREQNPSEEVIIEVRDGLFLCRPLCHQSCLTLHFEQLSALKKDIQRMVIVLLCVS